MCAAVMLVLSARKWKREERMSESDRRGAGQGGQERAARSVWARQACLLVFTAQPVLEAGEVCARAHVRWRGAVVRPGAVVW